MSELNLNKSITDLVNEIHYMNDNKFDICCNINDDIVNDNIINVFDMYNKNTNKHYNIDKIK
tara:strand:+ start:10798 stop:10983 length:186 start_codon:yes stop_codon:yes gene_type:complete